MIGLWGGFVTEKFVVLLGGVVVVVKVLEYLANVVWNSWSVWVLTSGCNENRGNTTGHAGYVVPCKRWIE